MAQVARATAAAAARDLAAEALGCQASHRAGGNGQGAAKGKLHFHVREAGEKTAVGSGSLLLGLWATEKEGDPRG